MKKLALLLALPLMFAGCKQTTAPTPPLAPGYSSQADENIGRTLAAAHAYYVTIQADIASGKYAATAAEKQAYNALGFSLNTAQAAYLAYHNGTGTLAAAQTATAQVTTQMATLQASVGAK